jgi:lipoprotein-releasing system permease protein
LACTFCILQIVPILQASFSITIMLYIPLFMAFRLIRAQTSSNSLSFIAKLCFSSIVISTASLALIAAIMQGFHYATIKTLKGISPDLIIKPTQDYINIDKITKILEKDFSTSISATMPCNFYHVLLQHPQHIRDFSHVALIAAVDPTKVNEIMPFIFSSSCIQHQHSSIDFTGNTILMGNILAEELQVACGDVIIMRYPDDPRSEDENEDDTLTFATTKVRVIGLFHSGVEEWDARGALISLDCAHSLFNDENFIQQLYLKLKPDTSIQLIQQLLHKRLRLPILSWYDMNPALVSALTLEKCAMLSILILIMLITGVTTAALLCMQLTYHNRTIAVLATYGMSFSNITTIFIAYGMLIAFIATGIGLGIASILAYGIEHYQLITLPNIYYVSHVPAQMSWSIAAMVLLLSLTISALAAWYPARKIRYLPLARILADV